MYFVVCIWNALHPPRKAIVIAVGKFDAEVADLRSAIRDANSMRAMLTHFGFEVKMVVDCGNKEYHPTTI